MIPEYNIIDYILEMDPVFIIYIESNISIIIKSKKTKEINMKNKSRNEIIEKYEKNNNNIKIIDNLKTSIYMIIGIAIIPE